MDCLRSAKLTVSFTESFVFGSETFSLRITPSGLAVQIDLNSKFQIQGFKNVDVYGIKFIPKTSLSDSNYYSAGEPSTYVWGSNNYDITINLDGQKELLGGINVLPGTVVQSTKDYILNNFAPDVMFSSPIKSCKSIDFGIYQTTYALTYSNSLAAAGHNFVIRVTGDFYLYYKFEGE